MPEKVKSLNLKKQDFKIHEDILHAINSVLKSGEFIGGKEVKKIETSVAKTCGAKFGIAVNSGTDALFLSLKALGIKEGDEVITCPFTFIATAEIISACGARPVFVDADYDTFNINSELIEKAITSKTKAIIPIHLFGKPAEMNKIMQIAKKYHLFVIEDAAQAIGAEHKNKVVGSIGDLGCFSFFPSKNLGCYGDGGMIVTNSKKITDKLFLLRSHGSSPKEKYLNIELGVNSRLDAVQAAVLNVKIKYLKKWNKERKAIAKNYSQNLNNISQIELPKLEGVFNQYTIKAQKRDRLVKFLKSKGVEVKIYYPLPLHLQPAFKALGYKKGDFPISEKLSNSVLSLPIYPEMEIDFQNKIILLIKDFYGQKN